MIGPLFSAWERRLASVDTNRVIRPFEWGLDWLGLPEDSSDPLEAVRAFARDAVAASEEFYALDPTDDYELSDDGTLRFPSALVALKRNHPTTSVLLIVGRLEPTLMLEAMRAAATSTAKRIPGT